MGSLAVEHTGCVSEPFLTNGNAEDKIELCKVMVVFDLFRNPYLRPLPSLQTTTPQLPKPRKRDMRAEGERELKKLTLLGGPLPGHGREEAYADFSSAVSNFARRLDHDSPTHAGLVVTVFGGQRAKWLPAAGPGALNQMGVRKGDTVNQEAFQQMRVDLVRIIKSFNLRMHYVPPSVFPQPLRI
ncbi:hypothetical protein CONLIGDRAFT_650713 [Coniochaeta ligniaria NRRL 30616]|uniref:Uncharacterized protein n=1 Tax=Coniochaeta ligniaria NRRL 30616 TaxID=1408157 RepID=A0A1J7I3M5_9PEZI|nr:hypothetical protein CONLIGDRAFT_650713 [Coniochaeta ligniaria NRRL 30616]